MQKDPKVIAAYLGGEVPLNLEGRGVSVAAAQGCHRGPQRRHRTRARTRCSSSRKVEIAYGGIQAVKGIDLHVDAGELVCLIGANGAGKTTTLKGICGLQPVKAGTIRYAGENVTGSPRSSSCAAGSRWCPRAAACSAR